MALDRRHAGGNERQPELFEQVVGIKQRLAERRVFDAPFETDGVDSLTARLRRRVDADDGPLGVNKPRA